MHCTRWSATSGNPGWRLPCWTWSSCALPSSTAAPTASTCTPRMPARAGILGVHVDAVGAAVDDGSAQLDQVQQGSLQPGLPDVALQRVQCMGRLGGGLHEIESWLHLNFLLC